MFSFYLVVQSVRNLIARHKLTKKINRINCATTKSSERLARLRDFYSVGPAYSHLGTKLIEFDRILNDIQINLDAIRTSEYQPQIKFQNGLEQPLAECIRITIRYINHLLFILDGYLSFFEDNLKRCPVVRWTI